MTTLRVATLNVWGLWGAISRHLLPRMDAIAARASELSLDVFGIQESWTTEGRDRLVAGLREAGLPHVWHNPRASGGSGLVLFSRHAFRELHFERFRLSGLPERLDHGDWYGGKGVVLATIETQAGPVDLLDTHLVAHYEPVTHDAYFGHRVGQVIEIADLLSRSDRPVIAVGDFNLREDGPEYPILTGLSGLVDAAAALDVREDTTLAPHPYRPTDDTSRIDYVWTRDGRGVSAQVRQLERVFDEPLSFGGEAGAYSDHAGLVAEIALSRSSKARPWPGSSDAALELAREGLGVGRALAETRHARQRRDAGFGLGLAATGAVGQRLTRRAWLQRTLLIGAGISALGGGGALALATVVGSQELEAFSKLEALLETLPLLR